MHIHNVYFIVHVEILRVVRYLVTGAQKLCMRIINYKDEAFTI